MKEIRYWLINLNPTDARYELAKDDVCQTITARCGKWGGNIPMIIFVANKYAEYEEGLPTLRASGGDAGGGQKEL